MGGLKMQDQKMEDQMLGVENAGPENAGPKSHGCNSVCTRGKLFSAPKKMRIV